MEVATTSCKTNLEHKIILDGKLDHHGPDDERTFQRHKLRPDCKRKAETGP